MCDRIQGGEACQLGGIEGGALVGHNCANAAVVPHIGGEKVTHCPRSGGGAHFSSDIFSVTVDGDKYVILDL